MQWVPCSPNPESAAALARFGHTCSVVDAAGTWGTELIVLFGGVVLSNSADAAVISSGGGAAAEHHAARADVHVLTGDGADAWFQPQIHGPLPAARAFHSAAVIKQHVYVFGGHVVEAGDARRRRSFFNDLWRLDTETWRWEQLSAGSASSTQGPSRRDMTTLTACALHCGGRRAAVQPAVGDDALLVFGGRNESGRTVGDMWLYDLTEKQWHPLKAGGAQPVARKMHAAVYVNGRVLMFGGERDSGALDDFWSLKLPTGPLVSWLPQQLQQQQQQQQHAPPAAPLLAHGVGAGDDICRWTQIRVRPAPTPRFGHSLVAGGGGGRLLLMFGGCLDTAGFLALTHAYVQCAELWVLDLASFSWSKETPLPTGVDAGVGAVTVGPTERMCHSMVALSDSRFLLLGGRRKEGVCRDNWWLHVQPPQPVPPTGDASQQDPASSQPLLPASIDKSPSKTVFGGTVVNPPTPAPAAPPSLIPNPSLSTPALLKSFFNPGVKTASNTSLSAAVTPLQGVLQGSLLPGSTAPGNSIAPGAGIAASGSAQTLTPISTAPHQTLSSSGISPSTTPTTATAAVPATANASGGAVGPSDGVPRNISRAKLADLTTSMAASASAAMSKLTGKLRAVRVGAGSEAGADASPGRASISRAASGTPDREQATSQAISTVPVSAGTAAAAPATATRAVQLEPTTTGVHLQTNGEFQAFRAQVLHLPSTPQALQLASDAQPQSATSAGTTFDVAAARAVLQELQQFGQQPHVSGAGGSNLTSHMAVARARSYLCGLDADEVTLQDLQLVAHDYSMLAHSHSLRVEGAGLDSASAAGGLAQLLASGLSGLSCMHLLPHLHNALRVQDVPLLLTEYRQLCCSLLPGAPA